MDICVKWENYLSHVNETWGAYARELGWDWRFFTTGKDMASCGAYADPGSKLAQTKRTLQLSQRYPHELIVVSQKEMASLGWMQSSKKLDMKQKVSNQIAD